MSIALVPVARSQDQAQLVPLGRNAAAQIEKFARKKNTKTVVLVVDFARHDGQPTDLGVKLADEFADSLRAAAGGFTVIDRKVYRDEITAEGIAPEQIVSLDECRCVGVKLKADLIVRGTVEPKSNELILQLEVARPDGSKRIFEGDAKLPLTAEMQALLSTSSAAPSKSPLASQLVWVNPNHPPVPDQQTVFSQQLANRGDSYPRCASCPSAEPSEPSPSTRFSATVYLRTQIDTDGFPAKISVVRGAPCGLTAKAVEAVSRWRFKPAMASNGKPVVSEQMIEVVFHLH